MGNNSIVSSYYKISSILCALRIALSSLKQERKDFMTCVTLHWEDFLDGRAM